MYALIGALSRHPRRLRWATRLALALPRHLAFALVTTLGWSLFLFARGFRATVQSNLAALLPGTTPRQRTRLCRRYIVHECLTVYEQLIEYRRGLAGKPPVVFTLEGEDHLAAALERGHGAIVYTAHVGNYFYAYWRLAQRCSCLSVVTAGSPELRPFFLGFQDLGLVALDYDNEPPHTLALRLRRHLRANGVIFLLGDFSRPNFDPCTLFGRPSPLPAGAFTLALGAHAPVLPLVTWRESWFRHRIAIHPPICLDQKYTLEQKPAALRELAAVLEGLIRRAPEQWLYWFNVQERWMPAAAAPPSADSPPVAAADRPADRR